MPAVPKKKDPPKPKRGRPVDPRLPRERIFLRADEAEVGRWTAEAERYGVPLSTWIRITCNAAVKR